MKYECYKLANISGMLRDKLYVIFGINPEKSEHLAKPSSSVFVLWLL